MRLRELGNSKRETKKKSYETQSLRKLNLQVANEARHVPKKSTPL
jgi:hypothetical protein